MTCKVWLGHQTSALPLLHLIKKCLILKQRKKCEVPIVNILKALSLFTPAKYTGIENNKYLDDSSAFELDVFLISKINELFLGLFDFNIPHRNT